MSFPDHYGRAVFLFRQRRFELARAALEEALRADPRHACAHALLALCLAQQERWEEAERAADTAVGLEPGEHFGHYARASVLERRRRYPEAAAAAQAGLRLHPRDPELYHLLGHVRLKQERWEDALSCADTGLEIDPGHVDCAHLRVAALLALERKGEAGRMARHALAHDPQHPESHAWRGWTLLEEGSHRAALESFREALRLDPTLEVARLGIVEALKARNPVYRHSARLLGRVTGRLARVPTGAWIAVALVTAFLLPGLILLLVLGVALATSLVDPLGVLWLRLDPFGRLTLSRDEVRESTLVGGLLLGVLACAVAGAVTEHEMVGVLGIVLLLLVIPVAAFFRCSPGAPRRKMVAYGAGSALLGIGGAAAGAGPLLGLFVLLMVFSPWVARRLERGTSS